MPADGTTDLVRLVDLARAAFELSGRPQPRSPWPEPLPERIDLASMPAQALTGMRSAADGLPAFLLADVPDDQTQPPVGWDPGLGNLLVFGGARSGKTTALASAVAAWTRTHPPTEVEVHLLDFGADGLAPLAALPHVAGHVRSADRESLIRLAKLLKEELRQRKDTGVAVPRVIVAVDGLGSLLANQYTDAGLEDVITDLESVYAEGAAVGIHFVASVDRPAALPGAWHERTAQKLILALADIDDYGRFGIRNQQVPAPQPGRGVIGESAREVQVACLGGDPGQAASTIAAIAAAWPGAPRVRRIRTLPEVARLAELPIIARTEEHPWSVPIGVEQASLEPSALLVREHGHVLLAGPPLSGRSTLLCTIAMGIAASGEIPVFAYAPRSSPVRRLPAPVRVAATLAELTEFVTAGEHERAPVVVVDDADVLNSGEDLFAALTGHEDPGIHVIAVSRNEATSNMPYWLSAIRRCKTGVLLMPGRFDGDLFGDVTLPARPALGPRTGRGYLVQDGRITSVQAAVPDLPEPA